MYSKVTLKGHPIHPMLVPFPIAFYTATLVSFIIYAFNGNPFWFKAGIAANWAGVVMALVAAVPGLIDYSSGIPKGTDAKRHGRNHMLLNTTTLVLFAINLGLNAGQWNAVAPVMRLAILLPLVGVGLTVMAGYLGWTLVQTHHVGVQLSPEEERCVRAQQIPGRPDITRRRAA